MNRKLMSVMFVMTAVCGLQAAQATSWDAVAEFSSTSNTATDTWQYLTVPLGGSTAGAEPLSAYGANGWWDGVDGWGLPYIGKVGSEIQTHPGGNWQEEPSAGGRASVLAWRSPVSSLVNATFTVASIVGDEGANGIEYWVFNGSTQLEHGTAPQRTRVSGVVGPIVPVGPITTGNFSVSPGDMVTLQIGTNGMLQSDTTSIQFVVSQAVPEPSTFCLLVSGLIGLLAYAWRKRK